VAGNKTSNTVATQVVAGLSDAERHLGAVVLRGFLHAAPTGSGATDDDIVRLYTDETFRTWYEIRRGEILHHIETGTDPFYAGGVVWLRREAPVTRCMAGRAFIFTETEAAADDPAGGPRYPHYP
jgi:hypothetical protein